MTTVTERKALKAIKQRQLRFHPGDLLTADGNAVAIIDKACALLERHRFTKEEQAAFVNHAQRAGYGDLLRALREYFNLGRYTKAQIEQLLGALKKQPDA